MNLNNRIPIHEKKNTPIEKGCPGFVKVEQMYDRPEQPFVHFRTSFRASIVYYTR